MERAVPHLLVGLLALALVVVLGIVAVRGVGELTEAGGGGEGWAEPAWSPQAGVDPAFVYAPPEIQAAAAPERHFETLPDTLAGLRARVRQGPPAALVRARLAAGDADTRRALAHALRSLRRAGATEEELDARFGRMIVGPATEEHCGWLRQVLAEGGPPLAHTFWDALIRCADAETAAMLARADAPPAALLAWWERHRHDGGELPVAPLREALVEEASRGSPGPVYRGTTVLLWEGGATHDEMRALARRVRDREGREAMEAAIEAAEAAGPKPRTMDERVGDPAADLDLLVATTADVDRLSRALVRCATASPAEVLDVPGGDRRAAECLRALHGLEPSLALVAGAAAREQGWELSYARELWHALLDLGSEGAVLDRLMGHGLLRAQDLPAAGTPHALAARDHLIARRRATCFRPLEEAFPVHHEALATRLVHLARPALDEVIFDQLAPHSSTFEYELHAYTRGFRHTVRPQDLGLRYDVEAVVGLLNSLLSTRGSDIRVAWLARPDADLECLVAGPERELLAAERAGLITLEEPARR